MTTWSAGCSPSVRPIPTSLALCPAAPGCGDSGVLTLVSFYQGNTFPSADAGNTHRNTFNNGMSFFVQDDFRLRSSFTLNFGLRWEYFGPLGESHNLLSNLGRDGNLALVGTDGLDGALPARSATISVRASVSPGMRCTKTVVRGGYGIYLRLHSARSSDCELHKLRRARDQSDWSASGGVSRQQLRFHRVSMAPILERRSSLRRPRRFPPPGADIFFTPRNLVTPYVQNWNLNIQQNLADSVALQVGLRGQQGNQTGSPDETLTNPM